MKLSAIALIEQLKPDAPDRDVAALVALYMLESDRRPYHFSINHDIRPPAMKRCPLRFEWAIKDRVGIKTNIRAHAEKWIIEAALAGYTISREGREPVLTMSLDRARQRAWYAQFITLHPCDDIPL
jgi:hypothetical protein